MPAIPPLRATAEWLSPLAPEQCVPAIIESSEQGWNVTNSGPGWVQLRGGSRAVLRLIGVFVPYGRARVPWRAVLHALPSAGESAVSVTFTSDQGAYLLPPIPGAVRAWADRFEELDRALRDLTRSQQPQVALTMTGGGSNRFRALSSRNRRQRATGLASMWAVLFAVFLVVNSLLDAARFGGGSELWHAAVSSVIFATVVTALTGVIRRR